MSFLRMFIREFSRFCFMGIGLVHGKCLCLLSKSFSICFVQLLVGILCERSCICNRIDSVPFWRMHCMAWSYMNCWYRSLFSVREFHVQIGILGRKDRSLFQWNFCINCSLFLTLNFLNHWNWMMQKESSLSNENRNFLILQLRLKICYPIE